jgi:hypothetical protein
VPAEPSVVQGGWGDAGHRLHVPCCFPRVIRADRHLSPGRPHRRAAGADLPSRPGRQRTAQRRREEMKARGAKVKDELASAWASLRAHVQEQFEKMRPRLEEKPDDLDAKAAEWRAERAEANAADAVDFASYRSTKPMRRPWRLPRLGRSRMPCTRARHRRRVRSDVDAWPTWPCGRQPSSLRRRTADARDRPGTDRRDRALAPFPRGYQYRSTTARSGERLFSRTGRGFSRQSCLNARVGAVPKAGAR